MTKQEKIKLLESVDDLSILKEMVKRQKENLENKAFVTHKASMGMQDAWWTAKQRIDALEKLIYETSTFDWGYHGKK